MFKPAQAHWSPADKFLVYYTVSCLLDDDKYEEATRYLWEVIEPIKQVSGEEFLKLQRLYSPLFDPFASATFKRMSWWIARNREWLWHNRPVYPL